MKCTEAEKLLPAWLNDELPPVERAGLDAHLAGCAACQREFTSARQVWRQLATVSAPEPGPGMRTAFYGMLDEFIKEETARPSSSRIENLKGLLRWLWRPAFIPRLAFGLVLLGIGAAAGYWFRQASSPDPAYRQQIEALSAEVQEMRQMMMLSLLENPSATERLRAVSYTKDIQDVDGKVIDALLTTLNNDPNVNVRLVTLEALAELGHDARVREGLVQSLTKQDSPLVQVALADVMVRLQEKRSLQPLRQLLRQKGINNLVKSKLEQTIKELS